MAEIRRTYLNARNSGSFSGIDSFLRNRKKWKNKEEVEKELQKIQAYSVHKLARKKFKRRPVKVLFLNEVWGSDLRDVSSIAEYNNCNNFVLVVIDIFSKFAYTRMLKDKSNDSMIRAFKSVFREAGKTPSYLWTDHGREYYGKAFVQFLKQNNVRLYSTFTHIKSSMAERFILTLFTAIQRYMTAKNTLKIQDKLQEFTNAYNSSYHQTLKRSPKEITESNAMDVWFDVYSKMYGTKPSGPSPLKPGDIVRISREKALFEKAQTANWSFELFKVKSVRETNPRVFYLEDMNNEPLLGAFYLEELQKADAEAK